MAAKIKKTIAIFLAAVCLLASVTVFAPMRAQAAQDQINGHSLIAENDYKATEGRSFLKRLYDNSIQNMVATLYGRKALPPSEVEELRAYLNELLKEDSTQEEE